MTRRIDPFDTQILNLLRKDASVTLEELARTLKVPRATVQYHVQKLRTLGAIQAIRAVPNFDALGRPIHVFIFARFEHRPRVSERLLSSQIATLPGVERVYEISGEWDLIVEARMESVPALTNLLIDRIRQMPGVATTSTLLSLLPVKE